LIFEQGASSLILARSGHFYAVALGERNRGLGGERGSIVTGRTRLTITIGPPHFGQVHIAGIAPPVEEVSTEEVSGADPSN
jgi:hypothetical protein